MLMTPEELSELRDHIGLARSKAINFGICFGRSSAKNLIMNVDRQKSPMLLERYAKLDGESPRSLRGTFRLSGNRFIMDLQGRVPQGGAWQLHQFFRKLGYPFLLELIEPGADTPRAAKPKPRTRKNPAEKAAPSAPEEHPGAQEDGTDPLQARWAQLCPRLEQAVAAFEASAAPKAGAVRKAWLGAQAVAERGDPASALKAAARIKAAIFEESDPAPETDADADAEKWRKIAPELGAQIQKLSETTEGGAKLHQAWAEAENRAKTGDHKTALLIARKLVAALKRVRTGSG